LAQEIILFEVFAWTSSAMTDSGTVTGLPSRLGNFMGHPLQIAERADAVGDTHKLNTFTSKVSMSIARSMNFFSEFGDLRLQATLSQGGVMLDGSMIPGIPRNFSSPITRRAYSEPDRPISPSSAPDISRHVTDGKAWGKVSRFSLDSRSDSDIFRMDSAHEEQVESGLLSSHTDMFRQESAISAPRSTGLSKNQVVVYLVTAILGCGVVVLPSLMKLGGWLVVPILTGLTSLAFVEVARMMDLAIGKAEKHMGISSFEDLGRAAMNQVGVGLIRTVTGTGFFGTLIVYTILIGHNVSGLLDTAFSQYNAAGFLRDLVSVKLGIFVVTPVLLVLAILKDSTLANIMAVGMFASLTSCMLICIKGYLDAHFWMNWPEQELSRMHNMWPEEPASVGTVLAVLFAAFSVMGTVPCIRGQMHDKQQFLPAFRLAMSIVFCMYLAVMLLGYWGYGNYVQHNVVDSMMFPPMTPEEARKAEQGELPHGHGGGRPVGIIMAVLVTLYLFLSFSLFFKCTAGMIQNLVNGMCKLENSDTERYAIRLLLVIVVVLVATAVPHFRALMAIMSAICCSCNNVFFPLLFAFKLEDGEFRVSMSRRLVHSCICILGLFCFCLGLYNSVSTLIKEMEISS